MPYARPKSRRRRMPVQIRVRDGPDYITYSVNGQIAK